MKNFPIFSVIIPTYNRAHCIKRAIDSIFNQTFLNFELIIVDDGSKDDTEKIIKDYRDNRIVFLKHPINKGQNAALNTGIASAKGEYISFLDSDDEWMPTMLEKQYKKFLEDPDYGCVYSWAGYYQDKVLTVSKYFSIEGYIYKEALIQGYISHMITLSTKSECFSSIGNFDINFIVCQDDDICFRLAKFYKFGLIKEPLAIIHTDSNNQIITDKRKYADGWNNLFSKFEKDIASICGNRTANWYLTKIGYLYIYAKDMRMARKALIKALIYKICLKTSLLLLVTYSPFIKLNHKVINRINIYIK